MSATDPETRERIAGRVAQYRPPVRGAGIVTTPRMATATLTHTSALVAAPAPGTT